MYMDVYCKKQIKPDTKIQNLCAHTLMTVFEHSYNFFKRTYAEHTYRIHSHGESSNGVAPVPTFHRVRQGSNLKEIREKRLGGREGPFWPFWSGRNFGLQICLK